MRRQRQRRESDAKRDKERQQCGERGGNSTNSRHKRYGGATREEAMQLFIVSVIVIIIVVFVNVGCSLKGSTASTIA